MGALEVDSPFKVDAPFTCVARRDSVSRGLECEEQQKPHI